MLIPEDEVPEAYFVPEEQLPRWQYLKGAKREPRVNKTTDHAYFYAEGSMAFPDLPENPSRTILTGEGEAAHPASSTSCNARAAASAGSCPTSSTCCRLSTEDGRTQE